ncbi:MAG: glycogen-binding domain-containing protein, partial [Kiritimatiellia bacterium]|nr:glycogen-binding domain-containing protein [Kiritimatiellia bacterium]
MNTSLLLAKCPPPTPAHPVARRFGSALFCIAIMLGMLCSESAFAARVSVKAFDLLAQEVDLAYIRSGTSEIQRLPMERTAHGVWYVDFAVPAGDYEYRFVVDDEWMSDIANPEYQRWADGSVWSRFSVPGENDVFANYRLPAAAAPPSAPAADAVFDPPASAAVSPEAPAGMIAVTFRFYAPLAREAAVVGTFNDWNDQQNRMTRRDGFWECLIPLAEGTYEYKFKLGEEWYWDPDRPPKAPGENSVITVAAARPPPPGAPFIQPQDWQDTPHILLAPATGLHAFQQELLRAYIVILGSDQHHLKITDGSLLTPDILPGNPPARWEWEIVAPAGRSMMALSVDSNTAMFELKHPLLDPPRAWLADYRHHAESLFTDATLELAGPTTPPPASLWTMARQDLAKRQPFSEVVAINRMTAFGRENGWSAELLREMAIIYADMSVDYRHPGVGGWAPMVFAARAVVLADLARTGDGPDETMAYVLCRIGRPGDGAAFLPPAPDTLHGHLAAAMATGDTRQLLEWAGSPQFYGLTVMAGQPTNAPAMDEFDSSQQAHILSILSDVLFQDGQENLSRCYLGGALKHTPSSFADRIRALQRGGVSAGHAHAEPALRLAGCSALWNSILEEGTLPRQPASGQTGWLRATCQRGDDGENIAQEIAAISTLYREMQHTVLDGSTEAVPQAACLLLLRDMLNIAWWQNARFYGASLYSARGAQRLHQIMATWKPFQPEMEAFTRFLLRRPLNEHNYGDIRRGFTRRERPPDTVDYIRMVRTAFRTWLMDEAQRFYPHMPTVQSDLYPDYEFSQDVYVFQTQDHLRAQYRRLAPMSPAGYPVPGSLPQPDDPGDIPTVLFQTSFALNLRLAREWSRTFDQASQEAAIAFFKRSLEICPYEMDAYRDYAKVLIHNGRDQEVIALADACPATMEGLERAALRRTATFAALNIGDTNRALSFSRKAANTGQSSSMSVHAYVLEVIGDLEQSLEVIQARDRRYGKERKIYWLARHRPEQAEATAPELFDWIEQFPDLEQARKENRFSFNALKNMPYRYAALDRWDRALWLLKPLAEAVQNDYIWFALMAIGQKTGDQAAMELGQHVLAEHVFNVWGDFARFMRHQTTWDEVLAAVRNEDKP